jgi:subtilisin family serine protease
MRGTRPALREWVSRSPPERLNRRLRQVSLARARARACWGQCASLLSRRLPCASLRSPGLRAARHRLDRHIAALLIGSLALGGCLGVGNGEEGDSGEANRDTKFLTYEGSKLEVIPGAYVVLFDPEDVAATLVRARAEALVAETGGNVRHVYTSTFLGFSVTGLTDAWAVSVSRRADVTLVRKDFRVYGFELRGGVFAPVPWNLDRVDQRAPFSLDRDYRLKTGPTGGNAEVPIYVVDNGIYAAHEDFAGPGGPRVTNVADVTGTNFARCSLSVADANHGTSVASVAAGRRLGITPTTVLNVKVLDRGPLGNTCTAGSAADVAAGLDAVGSHMAANTITKAVVNLSLGWAADTPDVAAAVAALQQRGALVVAAAGNENVDAAQTTPANLSGVVAVGATTQGDARWGAGGGSVGSNYGSTVALWAPGLAIRVADWSQTSDPTALSFATGTSAAAPHVSGAAALLWQQHPAMAATDVADALLTRATRNMLTGLGAGSVNRLLYVGEEAPSRGPAHIFPRAGTSGDLRAVRVANDWTRVYVAGGELSGGGGRPYGYAAYEPENVDSGPRWQVTQTANGEALDCSDIHASYASVGGGISGEPAYFACMGTHNGTREAAVVAAQQNNVPLWPGPTWLGPGSTIGGLTADYPLRVFVTGTRPIQGATGTEAFVASIDTETGVQVGSVVLRGTGFAEQFHRAVDLALVELALNSSGTSTEFDLVALTGSDPPGPDKTFLWRLDPGTLQIEDFRELPPPPLATNGMFPAAIAAQPLEANGVGIVVPGEVFVAGRVAVADGLTFGPWGYIYRLAADRVTGTNIDVVKDAFLTSLWSEDGDLYFGGMTNRSFAPGDLFGIRKPGANPDYDALLGKSEGTVNGRRWVVTYDTAAKTWNSGYLGSGAKRAFVVGSDQETFYVVSFRVY